MKSIRKGKKKSKQNYVLIGVIAAAVIIILAIALSSLFGCNSEPAAQPLNDPYLAEFLEGTGLDYISVEQEDFVYYELHTTAGDLAGFLFKAIEDGWGGPIELLIKTDTTGVIERVHVACHQETPVYVITMDKFLESFAGNRVEAELVWQVDVHGLTGATITAEAIINAVHESGNAACRKGIFAAEQEN